MDVILIIGREHLDKTEGTGDRRSRDICVEDTDLKALTCKFNCKCAGNKGLADSSFAACNSDHLADP